ncbi:hypothetical protein NW762_014219 [Fusarium torreyae]|uniref:Arylsulfotransferase n=1 Tax=Fusarium torreyae TaxID=1237075 RepID=A0A9W8V6Y4_9HYPO|nr:hypothetical protein NW762_014219 [Fusarium torreyae]
MKASILNSLATLSALVPLVASDWQYRSRPDLTPPKLNITIPAREELVDEGFLFITPYPSFSPGAKGPEQPGAYIFRDNGDLVWSGLSYFSGLVLNLRVETWNGQQVLSAFQGQPAETPGRAYGNHVLLNNKYEIVKTLRAASHKFASLHEFRIVDGKTALIEITNTLPVPLSRWGGTKDQNWILSTGFQEVDVETGRVLFEWESINHIDPKDSFHPLTASTGQNSSQAWDYFHLNSVEKDDQGNYIISARNVAALYKINGTTGEIIWTLGGRSSSFKVEDDAIFAYQHDTRLLHRSHDDSVEVLSLFDNAASESKQINSVSRARIVQIDHNSKTAKALHTYPAPDGILARSQGNTQVLPNGNVFTNWGQAGAITEFNRGGEVLFHAYLDSFPSKLAQSYRGFRFNWTGIPSEDPVIVVLNGGTSDTTDVYVSWNGDTKTASWRFYIELGERPGGKGVKETRLVGEVKRTGFETHLGLDSSKVVGEFGVLAEALDVNGKVLRRSPAAAVSRGLAEPPSHPPVSLGDKPTTDSFWDDL